MIKANGKAGLPATGKPATALTPRRQAGSQPGNIKAIRHGLTCSKLPKDAQYIEIKLNTFRRTMEAAVLAAKGEVSLLDAANVQTAVRWERHAQLAARWLSKMQDQLKVEQRLVFSREIARASSERDKALAALGLNAKPQVIDLKTYLEGPKP